MLTPAGRGVSAFQHLLGRGVSAECAKGVSLKLGSRSSGEGGSACNLRTLGAEKVERVSMDRSR